MGAQESIAGIYLIKNNITNKIYVGSSANIERRWKEHKKSLNAGTHHSPHLQASWDKYGKEAFSFSIIEVVDDVNNLIDREQFWLDELKPYKEDIGYNILPNAYSRRGVPLSEEAKQKMIETKLSKRITVTCVNCGRTERVPKSRAKYYTTCSVECLAELNRRRYSNSVEIECPICHSVFKVKPSQLKKRKCCSRACSAKYRKQKFTGKSNPNYRHGKYVKAVGQTKEVDDFDEGFDRGGGFGSTGK
ncbi:GIY-YIG nuclease family protein [Thermoactinomyces intermedius]|uniref:GIY-YIG nuclease family protein n=2 Tax=Thermoactinomyces TaxID=2023 RepID=A0A8I1AAZ4_THEIN|nr:MULTISPECIES: GIY-YIG nuclease family protein [Thermoactinomyces]MBA4547717.1 GIY-YIG nuclease family protein [Thermoactinomyces intermedius]MBA4552595.1 GIY-YIG nuclease family protein [Thermoactinomyces vulgaris]MBA4836409.1 GIY-YIG nuclease family protein [Thermoactinomyces intermedius]MBH8589741.1 GIY-YIG nuclease family protein [Thermoactinomyces vulgaris]MBH8594054.1 GIY-YIG nuclease family protein [Thermoactinomyces intermedius]